MFLGNDDRPGKRWLHDNFLIRTPPPIKTINEVHKNEIFDLVKSIALT